MAMSKPRPTNPAVAAIVAQIVAKMQSRGETPADVARYIGKPKSYQQVWEWLGNKKGTPRFENVQLLQTYLELPDKPTRGN